MKLRLRCKQLQEVDKYDNNHVMTAQAVQAIPTHQVTMAGLQMHTEDFDAYVSVDVKLLGDEVKIGDEFEVEIRKV